jgi:hypothetical protein
LTGFNAVEYSGSLVRFGVGRLAVVGLAVFIAGSGALPCVCAEMRAPEGSSGHCGPVEPGLQATAGACGCACMTARDEESPTPRVQVLPVRSSSVVPVIRDFRGDSAVSLLDVVAHRRPEHSPPTSPPAILRI